MERREVQEEARHPNKTHCQALSACSVSDRSGEKRLSATGLSGNDAVLVITDPVAVPQLHDFRFIQSTRRFEVNIPKTGILMTDVSILEAALECVFGSAIHFSRQNVMDDLHRGQILNGRIVRPLNTNFHNLPELKQATKKAPAGRRCPFTLFNDLG